MRAYISIKLELKRQNRPDTAKMTNGFVQHITVEESTSIQGVNNVWQNIADSTRWRGNYISLIIPSLKIWRSIAFTACHAPIPMTSYIFTRSNYGVIMMYVISPRRHFAIVLSTRVDNSIVISPNQLLQNSKATANIFLTFRNIMHNV